MIVTLLSPGMKTVHTFPAVCYSLVLPFSRFSLRRQKKLKLGSAPVTVLGCGIENKFNSDTSRQNCCQNSYYLTSKCEYKTFRFNQQLQCLPSPNFQRWIVHVCDQNAALVSYFNIENGGGGL